MSLPIFYIKNGCLSFGTKTILDNIELYINPGEKICLIGKNGSGKSSLLKVINADYELNLGDLYRAPYINIHYLIQDLVSNDMNALTFMMHKTNKEIFEAEMFLKKLSIPNIDFSSLSGGMKRKLLLAKSLMLEPDILMLDEPTNHLDITAIEWLEDYIRSYKGAVICISHDKTFLSNVTNRLWWIDRGILRKSDRGYKYFDDWQEKILLEESRILTRLGKKLEAEQSWLAKGVTARRKRNQGRLKDLHQLRDQYKNAKNIRASNLERIEIGSNDVKKSRFIIEARNISYSIQQKNLIKNFNIQIQKGEKIGVIGPNGSGKTSLVKLLIGELKPDVGSIRRGKSLDITYFDQHRVDLNISHSLKENLVPQGGDYVFLPNQEMHVGAYLKQFMFDPRSMNDKVSTLSGGERNRLLLATKLIKPGNLLVLDEPTNDLDMDSLEMLLDYLYNYRGTVIIISHDRDFLEKLVTRTIIVSDKSIEDLIGGYEDYKKYSNNKFCHKTKTSTKQSKNIKSSNTDTNNTKLSYKDQRLLEILPSEIQELEKEISSIESMLELDNNLYNNDRHKFDHLTQDLINKKEILAIKEDEWIRVEELRMILEDNKYK